MTSVVIWPPPVWRSSARNAHNPWFDATGEMITSNTWSARLRSSLVGVPRGLMTKHLRSAGTWLITSSTMTAASFGTVPQYQDDQRDRVAAKDYLSSRLMRNLLTVPFQSDATDRVT